jgi:hypothetical protein
MNEDRFESMRDELEEAINERMGIRPTMKQPCTATHSLSSCPKDGL